MICMLVIVLSGGFFPEAAFFYHRLRRLGRLTNGDFSMNFIDALERNKVCNEVSQLTTLYPHLYLMSIGRETLAFSQAITRLVPLSVLMKFMLKASTGVVRFCTGTSLRSRSFF